MTFDDKKWQKGVFSPAERGFNRVLPAKKRLISISVSDGNRSGRGEGELGYLRFLEGNRAR